MAKICISLAELDSAGLLKDTINSIHFDESDMKNILLLMARDYANGTLPEKYKDFKPPSMPLIELALSREAAEACVRAWINNS
jgi:hypothetical protein